MLLVFLQAGQQKTRAGVFIIITRNQHQDHMFSRLKPDMRRKDSGVATTSNINLNNTAS